MVIDAHLHCSGRETASQVLRALDEAQVDLGVLIAPCRSPGYSLADPSSLRRGNDHLAALVRGHADRLLGFAVVNPQSAEVQDELRRAVDIGLVGVKMVPSGWYPYEPGVQPAFTEAARLRLPVLLHSGVFVDGRSGRFARPVYFEALRSHRGLRITLTHLGWPWIDEAIAVGLFDSSHGVPDDVAMFRFDLSFGAPAVYRLDALRRALEVLGPGLLQFGSDCLLPCSGTEIAERRAILQDLLDHLNLDAAGRERLWSGTAAAWLGGLADVRGAAPREGPRRPDGRRDRFGSATRGAIGH